ncbi:hypothetical protein [Hymenobacter sp. 5317J-9]|nr:hypothetical protein [Hymenobacter sp. 5317J-9]
MLLLDTVAFFGGLALIAWLAGRYGMNNFTVDDDEFYARHEDEE